MSNQNPIDKFFDIADQVLDKVDRVITPTKVIPPVDPALLTEWNDRMGDPPVDVRLLRLRVELFTAAQVLRGHDLLAFKQLIKEVVQTMDTAEMVHAIENDVDFTEKKALDV